MAFRRSCSQLSSIALLLTLTICFDASAQSICEEAYLAAEDSQRFPKKEKAVAYFELFKDKCKVNPLYQSRLSAFYFELGRPSEAEAVVDSALRAFPQHRELLHSRGFLQLSRSDIDGARTSAQRLVQLFPNWYGGYYLMQRVSMDSKKFADSIEYGSRAIELSKGVIPVIYLNNSVANYQIRQFEACADSAKKAIEMDPRVLMRPWGINEAIYALHELKRYREALDLAKRRKNADPNWRNDPVLVKALTVMGVVN